MKNILLVGLLTQFLVAAAIAQTSVSPLSRLKSYIEIDTTNPPGNETRAVEFFAAIFDEEGISYETAESAPGRGNIWARLRGGDQPALVLLHHSDVVPATPEAWRTDSLKAVEIDGELYGRGALDTKQLGIQHLEAFLALHRLGQPLNRDVIFMATADEEAGGTYGAGWLVENRPDIFENVGFVLNEGGWGSLIEGQLFFGIEVAQKRPYWLRLVATDEPSHGAMPRATSATTRLVEALYRIQNSPFEPHLVPSVRQMFAALGDQAPAVLRDRLSDLDQAIQDDEFLSGLRDASPNFHALTRNTCSITILTGSDKINVVSPNAIAELDCRILPDQDADEFLEALRARVEDDQIAIEEILLFKPSSTSLDTDLYRHVAAVNKQFFPNAPVVPTVVSGFTDSHFFRELGIASYGYSPIVIPQSAIGSMHGNNERVDIAAFEKAVTVMTEIVVTFATSN